MASRVCEEAHCHDAQVLEVCKEVYGETPEQYGGKPVASKDSQGACKCTCSCLALGTPVAISFDASVAIQELRARRDGLPGDKVLARGKDTDWQEVEVLFSDGTLAGSRQRNAVYIQYGDTFIVVTANHLFAMLDGSLRMANRLAIGDELVDINGDARRINDIFTGEFYSGFHHIATSLGDPKGSLDNHLLLTNGVVSADFSVQLFSEEFLPENHSSFPELGTADYEERYGRRGIEPQIQNTSPSPILFGVEASREFQKTARSLALSNNIPSGGTAMPVPVFVYAKDTISVVPPDAHPFISDDEARAKSGNPRRPLSDTTPLDESLQVAERFESLYPDVEIDIDWHDDTVNAYAWGFKPNQQRRVSVKGGLIRDISIDLESVALVIAHEIGHHYGRAPAFPSGGSCEGTSDYYGASVAMRRFLLVRDYVPFMDLAIGQLGNFFSANPGNHGCDHPSRDCRVSIYNAAVSLKRIPDCATAT